MSKTDFIDKISKTIDNFKDPQALADGVFPDLDRSLETVDDAVKRKVVELLDKAEEKVRHLEEKKKAWWLSEIYLRKGRFTRDIIDKKREYSHWKDAYAYATEAGNHEMAVQSSLELGFTFVEFTRSLRDILKIQMNCVKAICASGVATTSRLRIIGINLYDFWRQLEYRRLSEHDLKAKQYIIDSAKSLESAGFDDETAAPVMILLISKVFDFEDPCLEWAQMEAQVLYIPVPEDVKIKMGNDGLTKS
jgi:hypothetical protein